MAINSIEVYASDDGRTITYIVPTKFRRDTAEAIDDFVNALSEGAVRDRLAKTPMVVGANVEIVFIYPVANAASRIQLDRGQIEVTIKSFFDVPDHFGFEQVPLPPSTIVHEFSRGCD